MKPDDILKIGKQEFMIIDPVKIEDFKSRVCFTQAYSPIDDSSNSKSKSFIPPFICPYAKTNEHSSTQQQLNSQTVNRSIKANVSISSHLPNEELFQVFTVLFGDHKPNKKHKDWTDDGILSRIGTELTLYNLEGEK